MDDSTTITTDQHQYSPHSQEHTHSNTTSRLSMLPDEILQNILQELDAQSLVRLSSTSRRFSLLANEPLLWKRFCVREFRYWSDRPAFKRRLNEVSSHPSSSSPLSTSKSPLPSPSPSSSSTSSSSSSSQSSSSYSTGPLPPPPSSSPPLPTQEWKSLYQSRHETSLLTHQLLSEIIHDPRARTDRIQAIVSRGYETKDTLLANYHTPHTSPTHLATRYWSHVTLGCLHRTIALETWTKIKYRSDVENATEKSLAALDMFVLDQNDRGDVDDIFERLDEYAHAVREVYPDIDEQTPRVKAMNVAQVLRDRRWVGVDQGREYHSLDNMFLGVALFSSHNNSLALITSVIYSYVARKFGLRAQPIIYPMHVHVVVQPPLGTGIDVDGNPLRVESSAPLASSSSSSSSSSSGEIVTPNPLTHLYMDPFNQVEPVPLQSLQHRLHFIGTTTLSADPNFYLNPATSRDLTIRSAHNILHTRSVRSDPLTYPISAESAIYAAFFALVLFPIHPASLRTQLTELTQHFLQHYTHDIHIFRNYILPLTTNLPDHLAYRNLAVQLLRNDVEQVVPKLRARHAVENPVRYRVGQLFRHRRRSYRALIYGWDFTCEMTQQWIAMNQVDRLPRGRSQPFYNVLVIDDRSTRYVAEENIVLLGPIEEGGNGEMVSLDEVETWPIEIGKWMKRFEVAENGLGWRFVSNVRHEYPED